VVFDGALHGAAGLGVVDVCFGDDGAGGEVLDVFPAEGDVLLGGVFGGSVAALLDPPYGFGGIGIVGWIKRSGSTVTAVFSGRDDAVADTVVEVGLAGFSGKADAGEALAGGEDDAAVLVVEGFGFVLTHDGELDAVDGFEFFEGHAEGLGDEDIDFQQGLAAFVVATQGVVALPVEGEVGDEVVVEQGGVGAPVLLLEFGLPAGLPEVGVVGGEG